MTDEIVYCPSGDSKGSAIEIHMGYWASLEARIQEIATVTPQKAPELLATFNRAALDLDRLGNQLELEYQMSVRAADKVRAEILLDRVPKILAEKGLSTPKNPMGSEDLRQAVLSADTQYQEALERSDLLKAMVKMIRGKYEAFERAFRSVRTLVGEQNFNYMLPNRNLSGDSGTAEPGAPTPPAGFGRAKY